MEGAVTWPQVVMFLTLAGSMIGVVVHYFTDRSRIRKEMFDRFDRTKAETERALRDLKNEMHALEVSSMERFASVSHLQEVETRLIDAISELKDEVKNLARWFQSHTPKT